ncbi:MAG: PD-(D/E)XK nuclease family protein, partial [Planctomycetia bacterium]|nr:PD-(D/E)XK nuclease family protein [Planctomycetia bacterium]
AEHTKYGENAEKKVKKGFRLFETPGIPLSLPPIQEMSVTDFSVFIENPYLFYLRRYLRLEMVSDSARELDAASFGSLLHRVVQRFGEEEITLAVDPMARASALKNEERFTEEVERIQVRLSALLKIVVAECFGKDTLPVVELQCAQLQERLLAFAEKQAEQYREGWQIWAVERKINAFLREDGGRGEILYFGEKEPLPMLIRGQLDRIDCRTWENGTREWQIWDYKTASKSPTEKHFGRKNIPEEVTAEMWKDLQLPLYMHVLRSERLNEMVPDTVAQAGPSVRTIDTSHLSVGYILLPKKALETKFVTSDWPSEVLESAEERIREIAQAVHDKKLENNGEMGNWDRKTVVEWILNPN